MKHIDMAHRYNLSLSGTLLRGRMLAMVLYFAAVLMGCNSTPAPTPTPEPTPATPQERFAEFEKRWRWNMSLLLENVEEIERHPSEYAAFDVALSVSMDMLGLDNIELPPKSDFKANEYDSLSNWLRSVLWELAPCRQVGALAFEFEPPDSEGVDPYRPWIKPPQPHSPHEALLEANAACKAVLVQLKAEYPGMFDCPEELGLCGRWQEDK